VNTEKNQTKVHDGHARSFAKGLTEKAIDVLLDTLMFSPFLATSTSASLAVTVEILCFVMNFFNERLWNLTDWNREVTCKNKVNEKCSRSIARGITGRILEVAVDTALLSIFTEAPLALGLAVTVEGICFITSFINDRLWNRTDWRRKIVNSDSEVKKVSENNPLQTKTPHKEISPVLLYNRFHPL
jgi:hypothetical protein